MQLRMQNMSQPGTDQKKAEVQDYFARTAERSS
jgi:hypothetical protein